MLWSKKKQDAKTTSVRSESLPTEAQFDQALDTLADVVRTFGSHAFDTDECEADELDRQCDAWASRVLIGTGPAGSGPKAEPSGSTPAVSGLSRDWAGLRHFVRGFRQSESAYVTKSLGNLRQAIQTFAQCLNGAVHEDRQEDATIESSINGLLDALSDNDTERIRAEAQSVVTRIKDAMAKRRQREQRQMEVLSERLKSLRSELTEARVAASVDGLTKLSNRQAFDEQVTRLRDLGPLFSHPPCLLMIDIDHFKGTNDAYGHLAGDAVLKEVANCLLRTFMRKQDFVSRFGGEEFAVLLIDTTQRSAVELAERARTTLRSRAVSYGEQEIRVTMSIGLATWSPGETSEAWLRRADGALYRAKATGRDRCLVAEPGVGDVVRDGPPSGARPSGSAGAGNDLVSR